MPPVHTSQIRYIHRWCPVLRAQTTSWWLTTPGISITTKKLNDNAVRFLSSCRARLISLRNYEPSITGRKRYTRVAIIDCMYIHSDSWEPATLRHRCALGCGLHLDLGWSVYSFVILISFMSQPQSASSPAITYRLCQERDEPRLVLEINRRHIGMAQEGDYWSWS